MLRSQQHWQYLLMEWQVKTLGMRTSWYSTTYLRGYSRIWIVSCESQWGNGVDSLLTFQRTYSMPVNSMPVLWYMTPCLRVKVRIMRQNRTKKLQDRAEAGTDPVLKWLVSNSINHWKGNWKIPNHMLAQPYRTHKELSWLRQCSYATLHGRRRRVETLQPSSRYSSLGKRWHEAALWTELCRSNAVVIQLLVHERSGGMEAVWHGRGVYESCSAADDSRI